MVVDVHEHIFKVKIGFIVLNMIDSIFLYPKLIILNS